jgi:hypothetical protein
MEPLHEGHVATHWGDIRRCEFNALVAASNGVPFSREGGRWFFVTGRKELAE